MKKKGVTLVEIVVAMAIFVTMMTLVVGAFTTVSRMKALTATMRESQQKMRMALELISRITRQANKVTVSNGGKVIELYFDEPNSTPQKFEIAVDPITGKGTLISYTCAEASGLSCSGWGAPNDLLGGAVTLNTTNSSFTKSGVVPPSLQISFDGAIPSITNNPYYSDDFDLETTIILENIK